MKRIILTCLAVTFLAGAQPGAMAQGNEVAERAQPHKIGLIDMSYLFTEYKKFQDLREVLTADIQSRQAEIETKVAKLKQMAEGLKQLSPGSEELSNQEKKLTAAQAEIEADKQIAKRELFRQESQIYQEVYGEVTSAVALYAKHYRYTLILRFTREESGGNDPQKIMQALQRQVVYNQAEDDITDKVLKYLNSEYQKIRQTSGTKPRTGKPTVE